MGAAGAGYPRYHAVSHQLSGKTQTTTGFPLADVRPEPILNIRCSSVKADG
jgi:hypothetical protein